MKLILTVAVLVIASSMGETKSEESSTCLRQLAPCLRYLNGSKEVHGDCCDPLKSVIRRDPGCLCRMISNRGSSRAEKAGINVNEAQMLPARCGEHVNPIGCLTGSQGSTNSDQSSSASASGFILQFQWMAAAAAALLPLLLQRYWT